MSAGMTTAAAMFGAARAMRDAVIEEPDPAKRDQMTRLALAIDRAPRVYPGPIGQFIASELDGYLKMAWRWAQGSLCEQLLDDILSQPVPPPSAHPSPR